MLPGAFLILNVKEAVMDQHRLFVGIDISKFKHDVAVIDEEQHCITPGFVVGENAEGYRMLFERLDNVRRNSKAEDVFIGMEATGSYWKNLYHFLHRKTSWHVTVINPIQTRRFSQSRLRRAVTDPVDALEIACYMQERKPAPTALPAPSLQIIQDIDKQILSLVKERNADIYRLRLELGKTFPELEKQAPLMTSQRLLTLLSLYPTAEVIRNTSPEELQQLKADKKGRRISAAFITGIRKLAENSIASSTGPDSGIVVQTLAVRITEIQTHICRLKKELLRVWCCHTAQPGILRTIPGIGPLTAALLEAYIGDVNRFPEYKRIVAYFGLDPRVCTSGISKRGHGNLQKKGNPRMRSILFMNVLAMIRFRVEPIYGFYQCKVAEGKPKLVAIGAAMRKLLVIIYTMMKKNEPFQPKDIKNDVKEQ